MTTAHYLNRSKLTLKQVEPCCKYQHDVINNCPVYDMYCSAIVLLLAKDIDKIVYTHETEHCWWSAFADTRNRNPQCYTRILNMWIREHLHYDTKDDGKDKMDTSGEGSDFHDYIDVPTGASARVHKVWFDGEIPQFKYIVGQ
jgi:hypothetical protein